MVQILPQEDPWQFGQVGKSFTQGAMNAYQGRADEMAIRNAIQNLGDNPQPRQILDTLMQTRTYNPASKQQFLKNYMGAQEFENTQKQAMQQKLVKQQELAMEKRRLDIEEGKAQAKVDKENAEKQKELAQNYALINQLDAYKDLSDDEKAYAANNMDNKTLNSLLVKQVETSNKTPDEDEFTKTKKRKAGEEYAHLVATQPSVKMAKNTLSSIDKLIEERGQSLVPNILSNAWGAESAKKLEGLSTVALEPIIKIFNKMGPIAVKKMEILKDLYQIKGSDTTWAAQGKAAALRQIFSQLEFMGDRLIDLYERTDGNPDQKDLQEIYKDVEAFVDYYSDHADIGEEPDIDQAVKDNAKIFKGRTVKYGDGRLMKSDGTRWYIVK